MAERTQVMSVGNYAAGIVLYNPEIKRLKNNIDAVCNQVKTVYCFNNGSKNIDEIQKLLCRYDNVVLIEGIDNLGIATALNTIVQKADEEQVEWLLTLDQDSVVCEGMVRELATLTQDDNVFIICPQIEDVRRKNEKAIIKSKSIDEVEFCITSGSFMNIKRTVEIGGFDDWLFIGLVDNEICFRARSKGLRILRNNSVVLNHELGNLTPSKFEGMYLKIGEILGIESIKKLSYKRAVSSMRLYYSTRNMIYLNYIYPESNYTWSNKTLIKNVFSNLIRGQSRVKLMKSVIRGIKDGKKYIKSKKL